MNKELQAVRAIKPLIRRHPWAVAGMVVLGLLEALAEGIGISLFIPFLYSLDQSGLEPAAEGSLSQILNGLFASVPADNRLLFISGAILALVLFKGAVSYSNGLLFGWVDTRLSHHLRSRVVDQLLRVSMRFIERTKSGKLWNALENETWTTADAVSTWVGLIINITTVVIFTCVLLLISWQLTLVVALALFVISASVQLLTRRIERTARASLEAEQTLSQRIVELFAGMRTIRAFNRQRHEQRRYDRASWQVGRLGFKQERLTGLIEPLSEVLAACLLIGVLFAMLHDNAGNLPAVLVFIAVLYRLHPEVYGLDEGRAELVGKLPAIEQVMGLLSREDKPFVHSGPRSFDGLEDALELERASFAYEADESPAISDVSLRIARGETTALVGPSGAGKSTLINLLLRFYEPTTGELTADGTPAEQFDLGSWREKIAVVDQDVFVFNATVRANIAYGKLGASEAEVQAAAHQADAHEFIRSLPQGYDTVVGDQGVRLSSGQKQRVALARAIVRQPEILILDEATNALDSISENVIQKSLAQLRRDRTVIVIAHRLSTIEQADQILVMDRGRIVERGTLADLLENNALFARLYELQKRPAYLEETA
ncbi:MAG: ABC transporter ATP-binding protein [Acidobacteriota bacterium]